MHVLMFEPRFHELVASGKKRHTIRGRRARPIKAGDYLSLRRWDGKPYRSRQLVLVEDVVALSVRLIVIDVDPEGPVIKIDGQDLMHPAAGDEFARRDGFADAAELVAWHEAAHGLPFEGVLIEWL
jgi:hypothetical protein